VLRLHCGASSPLILSCMVTGFTAQAHPSRNGIRWPRTACPANGQTGSAGRHVRFRFLPASAADDLLCLVDERPFRRLGDSLVRNVSARRPLPHVADHVEASVDARPVGNERQGVTDLPWPRRGAAGRRRTCSPRHKACHRPASGLFPSASVGRRLRTPGGIGGCVPRT